MNRLTTNNGYGVNVFKRGYECEDCDNVIWRLEDLVGEGSPTDKLARYEDLEERLENIYGECDDLLETIVAHFERHNGVLSKVSKTMVLTDDNIDKWKELKDRDVAKKPEMFGDGYADGEFVYDTWICPNCEEYYEIGYDEYDFCPKCGQKIDRSEFMNL